VSSAECGKVRRTFLPLTASQPNNEKNIKLKTEEKSKAKESKATHQPTNPKAP
jgi:hypothetical protein